MKFSLIFILAITSLVVTETNGQQIPKMNNIVFYKRMSKAFKNYGTLIIDDMPKFHKKLMKMNQDIVNRNQITSMYTLQNNIINQCSSTMVSMEKFYSILSFLQMDSSMQTSNLYRPFMEFYQLANSVVGSQMFSEVMSAAIAFSTAYNNSVISTNTTLITKHQNCATTLIPTLESAFNSSLTEIRPCLEMKIHTSKLEQSIGDWLLFWLGFSREVSGCCGTINTSDFATNPLTTTYKMQINRWCLENLAQKIPFAYGVPGMGSVIYYPESDIGPSSNNKMYDFIKLSEYITKEISNFGATTSSYFYGCFENYMRYMTGQFTSLKTSFEDCIK